MLLQGKHIFLVEDDPTNLAVMRVILQKEGARVPFDHWGDATLGKMINYNSFSKLDLILLDIMLPHRVSGYDILDTIKATPELQAIPVVAITASDPDIEIPKARARGFSSYISKPFDRNKFAKQILAILHGEQIWGGLEHR